MDVNGEQTPLVKNSPGKGSWNYQPGDLDREW